MSLYALTLLDLADDYLAYSRRSVDAVGRHGGKVTALGTLGTLDAEAPVQTRCHARTADARAGRVALARAFRPSSTIRPTSSFTGRHAPLPLWATSASTIFGRPLLKASSSQ
jgi:hypothetical protein